MTIKMINGLLYIYDENEQISFTVRGELVSYNSESITVLDLGVIYVYNVTGDLLSEIDLSIDEIASFGIMTA